MFDKILGTVLLIACAAEILTIVFKLIQPDCTGRLFGALLIPVYCLVMRFVIYAFFQRNNDEKDSD